MSSLIKRFAPAQTALSPAAQRMRQYLSFVVNGDTFGIPISAVKEIIEHRQATAVPLMPSFTRGVINLRGHAVPVIELAARFGRRADEITKRSCIVIVEMRGAAGAQDVGLAVDGVNAVLDIADPDIEPPPSFGATVRSDFISGMGKLGEQFVILLDIDRVLSPEELAGLGELEAGRAPPAAMAEAAAQG